MSFSEAPGRVKTGPFCELKFISRYKDGSTAKLLQVLQDLEIVVGLDSITNNRLQSMQRLLISLVVCAYAVAAVKVKWGAGNLPIECNSVQAGLDSLAAFVPAHMLFRTIMTHSFNQWTCPDFSSH